MQPEDYRFSIRLTVRDYEVDYQGIVNNSNYLRYMEHTRHEFCRHEGLPLAYMHQRGIDPVLSHADLTFLSPLHMGDEFVSCLNVERKGPRFIFFQDIFKIDGTPVAKGAITIACMENGRLSRGDVLAEAFNLK